MEAKRQALKPQAEAEAAEAVPQVAAQIELVGLNVVEREAAIGDWDIDISR